jgi:hypothetical protein
MTNFLEVSLFVVLTQWQQVVGVIVHPENLAPVLAVQGKIAV